MLKREANQEGPVSKKKHKKAGRKPSDLKRGKYDCLRCRLTETPCDRQDPECSTCTDAKVECLVFPPTANDILFGLPSNRLEKTNTTNKPGLKQYSVDWKLLKCSDEFLAEHSAGSLHSPEDVYSLKENPDRCRIEQDKLMQLLGQPLKNALEDYPAHGLEEDQDEKLPLPSSELLRCIGLSIAKSEASKMLTPVKSPDGQEILFSEHMSGSSLLALGVLLQEYSSYLL
ncbi:hypothetical protein IW140_000527 [Coemansia sp. RSA 1813]|nr:hypothetical protein EV178_004038 [Coemansia sp. RSA 1646]KAJ1773993.1 hypothetical protein LPJ74_000092 [Coemansia sp. RSA 1843]KAJ2092615.1 hypothetical protein IW138_001053 [Coemansia sp. RSA 986]KAJ2213373.1 hypothetical protein EV179_003882 [Coemansia sp. RSA 487]KAJ2572764.1 hypothetical protein IW140_000527 [Coemansia sp. RSA 1813]